jgi:hypothetical protein
MKSRRNQTVCVIKGQKSTPALGTLSGAQDGGEIEPVKKNGHPVVCMSPTKGCGDMQRLSAERPCHALE